jgi:flavin reductase (DIM6/NTAB) family NADH-FMN oxidoreductase RutF
MDIDFKTLDPDIRYKLLVGLIVPRPIAFVSTYNENGVANCAPFSFFNVISHEPPLVIVSFGTRDNEGAAVGKTDGMKDTPRNILRTGEFVVNMVDESIVKGMHIASGEFSEEESEFDKAGFTPIPAAVVKHPMIKESPASFECLLRQRTELAPGRVFLFGEIIRMHAREGIIDPVTRRVSETLYKPVGRLWGNRYCTTRERFALPGELPK